MSEKFTVTFNDETNEALKQLSQEKDRPIAVLIRRAVEAYLAQEGKSVNTGVSWGGIRVKKS